MAHTRDPSALVRHAIQAGDRTLVELIARRLSRQPSKPSRAARRAYRSLCLQLGPNDPRDYHRC